MRVSCEKFGEVIALIIDLINPQVIACGGVFMRNYDTFMKIMMPIIEREALGESLKDVRILPSALSENIGDLAALSLAVLD